MAEKSKFFKFFSTPIILICFSLAFPLYMVWKETNIKNYLTELSLKGNPVAIAILIKFKNPWNLDDKLVYATLDSNEHAMKILGIATNDCRFTVFFEGYLQFRPRWANFLGKSPNNAVDMHLITRELYNTVC